MPTIIGHHNITKGAKHWLTSPKREELFGPLGVTNIRTFVDPQNPTRVAVLMDVPDMDALAAAMQSKAAADAMAFDGVVPESLVILIESQKESIRYRSLHALADGRQQGAGVQASMPGFFSTGASGQKQFEWPFLALIPRRSRPTAR